MFMTLKVLSHNHLDSHRRRTYIWEINIPGFCLVDWTPPPNAIYKKLIKFVRKFYLLAWIEKDRDSSKWKSPLGPQSSGAGSRLGKIHSCKHRPKLKAQSTEPKSTENHYQGNRSGPVSGKRQCVPGWISEMLFISDCYIHPTLLSLLWVLDQFLLCPIFNQHCMLDVWETDNLSPQFTDLRLGVITLEKPLLYLDLV